MPYVVMVDDNYHYMDESERYRAGEFETSEEAAVLCRQIVDEYLESALEPGMTAQSLWDSYKCFGEDPFILSVEAPRVPFSAWDYARQRCFEIFGGQETPQALPASPDSQSPGP